MVERDEPVRVRIRERTQDDAVDEREDADQQPDREREDADSAGGERRRGREAAEGVVSLIAAVLLRPKPRQATPLALDATGIDGPSVVRDPRGRPVLANLRVVEPGVLYRGSAFPTSFPKDGGGREYADRTAFDHLRALNVTHVIAMIEDADAYYAEDGYLRYWSEQTGHTITTTWVARRIDVVLAARYPKLARASQ